MKNPEPFYNVLFALSLCFVVVGFAFMLEGSFTLFPTGLVFLAWGTPLTFVAVALKFSHLNKRLQLRERQGVIWVWAVALLSIVVLAIAWFALTWPIKLLYTGLTDTLGVPEEVVSSTSFLMTVIAWFLVFALLGILLWAYVNSQRREEVTYPIGY